MTTNQRVDLRSAIGGRWLTYIPPFAWLLPLWFSGSILSTKSLTGWPDALIVMGVNVVALGLCALAFLFFRVTLWRRSLTDRRGLTPVWLVVLGGLLLGATKAATTAYLSNAIFGTGFADIGGRTLASSALGAIVVVIVPIALSQLELYRGRREQLIHEIVRREVAAESKDTTHNRELLDDLIRTSLDALARVREKPETLPAVLDDLRVNEIRPLSHQIWQREQAKIPQFTLGNLMLVSLTSGRFVILPVVVGYVLLIGPSELLGYGMVQGAGALGLQAVVIAGALWLANALPRRGKVRGMLVFFAANIVMTLVLTAVTDAIFGPIPDFDPIQTGLAALQVLLTLTLFTSVYSLTRKTQRAVEDDLLRFNPDLGVSELKRAQQSRADRDLAQLLHSQVQNVFLAKSVEVKREIASSALSAEDRRAILERNLSELETYVRQLTPEISDFESAGLRERISRIEKAWRPVLDIQLSLEAPRNGATHNARGELIQGVLDEGISNAVRHGLATQVRVVISENATGISISIDDNGLGPRQGQPGLGSFFLTAIPGSEWTLNTSTSLGGACLRIQLAH